MTHDPLLLWHARLGHSRAHMSFTVSILASLLRTWQMHMVATTASERCYGLARIQYSFRGSLDLTWPALEKNNLTNMA